MDVAPKSAEPVGRTVFISHALEDAGIASLLRAELQRAGLSAASVADTLVPGDNILAAISAAIERSDVVVVLVTPHSSRSSWVDTEAALAVGHLLAGGSGRVVPLLFGDNVDIPFVLREFQGIQVEDASELKHVAEVIGDLSRVTASKTDELRRSAQFQREALRETRLRYEYERELIEVRTRRVSVALFLTVAVATAAGLITAMGAGESRWLELILTPAIALLTTAIGFYLGERTGRQLGEDQNERPQ